MAEEQTLSVGKQTLINKIEGACTVANSFEVREILEVLPDVLGDFLKEDFVVTLPGIGKFSTEQREETLRRNPKTGESVLVPPHKVIKFKLNTKLKADIR